jgi:hypothetical protein
VHRSADAGVRGGRRAAALSIGAELDAAKPAALHRRHPECPVGARSASASSGPFSVRRTGPRALPPVPAAQVTTPADLSCNSPDAPSCSWCGPPGLGVARSSGLHNTVPVARLASTSLPPCVSCSAVPSREASVLAEPYAASIVLAASDCRNGSSSRPAGGLGAARPADEAACTPPAAVYARPAGGPLPGVGGSRSRGGGVARAREAPEAALTRMICLGGGRGGDGVERRRTGGGAALRALGGGLRAGVGGGLPAFAGGGLAATLGGGFCACAGGGLAAALGGGAPAGAGGLPGGRGRGLGAGLRPGGGALLVGAGRIWTPLGLNRGGAAILTMVALL